MLHDEILESESESRCGQQSRAPPRFHQARSALGRLLIPPTKRSATCASILVGHATAESRNNDTKIHYYLG
jgi:hypothetical protein